MITVINFGHPLNAPAEQTINDEYGAGDANIYHLPIQLDVDAPLAPQLDAIYEQALALEYVHGNPYNVDCIIPPGHSVAASYLARRFPGANVIVMARRGVVPQFMPVELVRPDRSAS